MKVIKRSGQEVEFDKNKIKNAILKAMTQGSNIVKEKIADDIANEIANEVENAEIVNISDIEEKVYNKLISKKQKVTARAYEGYLQGRYEPH